MYVHNYTVATSVLAYSVGQIHCTNFEVKESEDNKVFGDGPYSVVKHKVAHESTTNEMDITIKVHSGWMLSVDSLAEYIHYYLTTYHVAIRL